MFSMHSTLDHAENEDKHLISHVASIINNNQVPVFNNSSRKITSSEDRHCRISNYELVNLEGERSRQLASVAVNNSNLLCSLSVVPFQFPFLIYYIHQLNCLCWCISKICEMSNSDTQCKCTCKCEPSCNGDFICLCLCNSKTPEGGKCCICICKKKEEKNSECKCLCICICKNEQNCSHEHTCKDCLIKVDIGSLKLQSFRLQNTLSSIRCCISKLENQNSNTVCCCCDCSNGRCTTDSCQSYCCCKEGKIEYPSIISKLNYMEHLFNQISEKIGELLMLKNTLSLMCVFATKCLKCPGCHEKIKELISNIEISSRYYYVFASRINDIITLVQYKFNYKKIQHLLCSLKPTVGPLAKHLIEINDYLVKATGTSNTAEKFQKLTFSDIRTITNMNLWIVYSVINITNYKTVIDRSFDNYKKLDRIFHLIPSAYACDCIQSLEFNGGAIDLSNIGVYRIIEKITSDSNINEMLKLKEIKKINELDSGSNHLCLCMVIKYVLYLQILKLMYIFEIDLEMLSTSSRKFDKYLNAKLVNSKMGKIFLIITKLLYNVSTYILVKYEYSWSYSSGKGKSMCYCTYSNDRYYPYLVSIIIYLSSLIENIWTTDNQGIVTAIESLSNLYSELKIYDFSSIDNKRQVSCGKVCSLIVNKQCKKGENKCCWCVSIANLIVACVSICVQFRFYKAIKNGKCEDLLKNFCEVEECKCKCPEANSGCCLLKLALSSQLCNNEKLKEWLEKCCSECAKQKNGCCQKICQKVKSGEANLLLLVCKCDSKDKDGELKAWFVLFESPWGGRSAAVVIVCKCKDTTNCCCLKDVIEKLKGKQLKELCENCQCQQLTGILEKICNNGCCEGKCQICNDLKTKLNQICGESDCLCKKIEGLKDLCSSNNCECKKAEGCCRCVCCKLAVAVVEILTRACRQNFLEPYKRITIELLSGTTDNQVIRSMVNSINNRTLRITHLLKNNINTHTDHKNIANSFPGLTMGYAYDTVYEHETTDNSGYSGINGIRKGYPNIGNWRIKIRNKL